MIQTRSKRDIVGAPIGEALAELEEKRKDSSEPILPVPYDRQREIIEYSAKFKIIACGRQVGKTMLCAIEARANLLAGRRHLYTSTSQKQTDQFWEYIKLFTADIPKLYKHDSRRIMRLGSGLLDVQTASQPDALRSGHYHKIDFDECAYLDPRVWSQVGLPMLLRYNGNASFWSTPKRRNWFFQHFIKARDDQQNGSKDWAVWNFSTLENPYLSSEALARLTENMTEEDYRQEILAEFLEGQGTVFRYVDDCCIAVQREPYESDFVFGVDWGKKKDFTVIIVMDRRTKKMVDFDRFNQIDWSIQRGRLHAMYMKWKPKRIWAEHNSFGDPNIEALQKEGLPMKPFETTAKSKPPLIESLILAFDRHEIEALNNPIIKGELMAYERTITSTDRSQL